MSSLTYTSKGAKALQAMTAKHGKPIDWASIPTPPTAEQIKAKYSAYLSTCQRCGILPKTFIQFVGEPIKGE